MAQQLEIHLIAKRLASTVSFTGLIQMLASIWQFFTHQRKFNSAGMLVWLNFRHCRWNMLPTKDFGRLKLALELLRIFNIIR
jgi:hypothetical protein